MGKDNRMNQQEVSHRWKYVNTQRPSVGYYSNLVFCAAIIYIQSQPTRTVYPGAKKHEGWNFN